MIARLPAAKSVSQWTIHRKAAGEECGGWKRAKRERVDAASTSCLRWCCCCKGAQSNECLQANAGVWREEGWCLRLIVECFVEVMVIVF